MKIVLLLLLILIQQGMKSQTLYSSDWFTIYSDRVVESEYSTVALSPEELHSDFAAIYNQTIETKLICKFAINKRDNETPPFHDHTILLKPEKGIFTTPLLTFGKPHKPSEEEQKSAPRYIEHPGQFDVTFRLDMRDVLRSFEEKGFFITSTGEKINAGEFEGVYIAGGTAPLNWDFGNFDGSKKLEDTDGDGIYTITLTFNELPYRPVNDKGFAVWQRMHDLSGMPLVYTPHQILNAIYFLTLDELELNRREDGAFNTGAKWEGVWTRDISYSTLLSLALVDPDACRISLLKKVKNGMIIQDTGTGGSWPISSDRTTWALAAWEIYLVTGDTSWLKQSSNIIKKTVEIDRNALLSRNDTLLRGESSFLDWREQSYPEWMQPSDIYNSYCLGTNAVHYQTYRILASMETELGRESSPLLSYSKELKKAINNRLFIAEKGYYGQYLYGRNYLSLSERSESLGEALAVLFSLAPDSLTTPITSAMPVTAYGVPSFYPQIPDIPPYHNNAIWQFVTGFYTWAAAIEKNEMGVMHGLASIFRSTALFLTNKENMTIDGKPVGTEINSDRQLWSIAATLAAYYRIFFGMEFSPDGIYFSPLIPSSYEGVYELHNFRYRNTALDISVTGSGNVVKFFLIDGIEQTVPFLPANIQGNHKIEILLSSEKTNTSSINLLPNQFSPPAPQLHINDFVITWDAVESAAHYLIYQNGKRVDSTKAHSYVAETKLCYNEYQIAAVSENGLHSFLSEPTDVLPDNEKPMYIKAEEFSYETIDTSETGVVFINLTKESNNRIKCDVEILSDATYSILAIYANGSGPVNTDNKAAIRTLAVDDTYEEPLIMPQRGSGKWDTWGKTNPVLVPLKKGSHTLEIRFEQWNENMNGTVNEVRLKELELFKLP